MHLLKILPNKEIKIIKKAWITTGVLKFINKKNKTYRKYIKTKNAAKNGKLFELFKTYINSLNKITKLSKANYYSEFFEENKKKNLKKYGNELKKLSISRKTPKKIQNISNNVKFITNHKNIANTIKSFLVDIPK